MKITFEGIDAPGDNATTNVADGYAGMDWTTFSALDPAGSIFIPSGANNGIVSGTSVAINSFANPATFASQSTDFALKNAWVTGVWHNGLTIKVEGWDDGVRVAKKSFVVNYDAATKLRFGDDFASVDSVTISSSGGTDADGGDASGGTHFAIDDIKVKFEAPVRESDIGYDPSPAELDATGFSHWMFA
jgi:hypothetical protein